MESPEPTNHTKDTERLAIQVAKILKERGYIIKGFGLREPTVIDTEPEDVEAKYG